MLTLRLLMVARGLSHHAQPDGLDRMDDSSSPDMEAGKIRRLGEESGVLIKVAETGGTEVENSLSEACAHCSLQITL